MAEVNVTGTTNLNVTPESEQITIGNSSVEASEQVAPAGSGGYHEISIPDELFQEQSTQESDTEQAVTTESEEPCLLYTSPSPRDRTRSRMPSSA